jgi:hypothetical protein
MLIHWNTGKRLKGDSRYTLVRFESKNYIRGEGRKLSISLHPYVWMFEPGYKAFRLTLLGLNIHYKKA